MMNLRLNEERFVTLRLSDGSVHYLSPQPWCRRCSKPIKPEYAPGLCYNCNHGETFRKDFPNTVLQRIIAASLYISRTPISYMHRDEMRALKETGEGASRFGEAIHHMIGVESIPVEKFGSIVPIPPTKERTTMSAPVSLATDLSQRLNLPVEDILEWGTEVEKQKRLRSPQERVTNVKGKMVATEEPSSSHVFLVDDIVTSGSTMAEAGRVLSENNVEFAIGLAGCKDYPLKDCKYVGVVVEDD